MNNFGIIIQKTKGEGLDFNIFPNTENLELRTKYDNLREDERDTPGLVKDKDIFVVQFSENFKIYSLIIGTKDGPRAGFYGIRIFIPINYNLQNFISILYNIQTKFLLNPNSSSSENQIYDDILEIIKNSCCEVNKFIVPNTRNNNHFCYYESNNSKAIEAIFNSNKTYLISKLYAFQKPNNEDELRTEIAINNTIYKEIDLDTEIVEIKIKGDINYLKEIKINNNSIKFNPNQINLILLCNKKDNVEYIISENAQKNKDNFTNEITISRKKNLREESNGSNTVQKKSFIDKYGTWIILILLTTLIILIIQQKYFNNPEPEKQIEQPKEKISLHKKDTISKVNNPKEGETGIDKSKEGKTGSDNSKDAKTGSDNSKGVKTNSGNSKGAKTGSDNSKGTKTDSHNSTDATPNKIQNDEDMKIKID